MGKFDKDLHQKESAIRFCLITGHLPFLEVNVENKKELSDTTTIITDIDALGICMDPSGGKRRVMFDCKTLGKTSPINRAFWASGIMQYTYCNEAFVILRKRASEAHRFSAKHINVHLFDEKQFTNYSESYSLDFGRDYSYATNIDNWIAHEKIYAKGSKFEKFGQFLNSETPLETDVARGLKRLLAGLKKGKGEFNPNKAAHLAIFSHTVMTFSFLMAQIVHDLKTIIDFDATKEEFEKVLRYYIWGGREAFTKNQQMMRLFSQSNSLFSKDEPALDAWDAFIELSRKLLDSPSDVFKSCFAMREMSIRNVAKKDGTKDLYLAETIRKSKRTRQFLMGQAKYLVKAVRLPAEFEKKLSDTFDELNEMV